MKRIRVREVMDLIERMAPLYLAEDWDTSGLQLGDPLAIVNKMMLSLDITREVIDQALKEEAELLISHHPLFFTPLKEINLTKREGQIIQKALKGGLTIYSAHTNLDYSQGGMNDYLASLFHLKDTRPLKITAHQHLLKLVVFVPRDHLQGVMEAICEKGAGWIGNYSHCTFQLSGEGTFLPLKGTDPYLGEVDILQKVEEVRLETILPQERREEILKALFSSHPYEEVAYDLYPLENRGEALGPGRLGDLPEPLPLEVFLQRVQKIFKGEPLTLLGPRKERIARVALCGGSGGDLILKASQGGADLYMTGDLKHHQILEAMDEGLLLLPISHHSMEKIGLQCLKDYLEKEGAKRGYSFQLSIAQEIIPSYRLS